MIRETLKNLPEGLGDTYKRILIKISKSPSRAKIAKDVFSWATAAKRPLHVEELKEAVAFGPDDKSWNVDKIPHEDLMFESCRGLIIKDPEDETVHFAHHTVRQYLTGGLATNVDPLFEISVVEADIVAGQTCVAYLSFSDFETQITSTTPTARLEQKGVLESGGPLWIPSILGIRKPMFDIPYRLLRGDPALRPSDPNYWKHLRPTPKSKTSPSTDLKNKYRLLSYVIDYWEPHTRWYHSSDSPFHRRLENLALHKTLAFDFRPWGPNQHLGPYGCIGCPSPNATSLAAKDLPHISMMHYAAEVGNLMLLACNYPTERNIKDYIHHERYHHETLSIACRHNRIEIVKFLCQQGGYDISDGRAVNAAATAGHAEVLEYLLSLYEDPLKQHGDNLLLLAAEKGDEAVVRVLTEFGARLGADYLRTIIESAARNGHESMIRAFGDQTKILVLNHDTTALHLAAANGHTGALRALLKAGIPRDRTDSKGRTALHVAVELGQSAVAETLLERGADPLRRVLESDSSSDYYGKTALDLAAKGGHVNVLELFKKYIDLEPFEQSIFRRDKSNFLTAALYSAAAGGHDKAIRWLIENGADINAADFSGRTSLQYALETRDEIAVRILLKRGATFLHTSTWYSYLESATTDCENKSFLHLVLEKIQGDRQTPLKVKCDAIYQALHRACGAHNDVAVELLEQEIALYNISISKKERERCF